MIAAEIVLTGGPCAGKTTALEYIRLEFALKGFRVLCVPEVATSFILSGFKDINDFNKDEYKALERAIFTTQRMMKGCYSYLGESFSEPVLIIYDRAEMDIASYVTPRIFFEFCDTSNITEQEILDSYDAVIHLTTAAVGAEEFYTLENPARRESSLEDARIADQRTMFSWTGHRNHIIIDNSTDFLGKMKKVTTCISELVDSKRSTKN